jgi:pSer/pThr/pTyr-binding forkhead associated (FHA) protein
MICDYCLYDDAKKKTNRKGILVIKINDNVDEDIITLGRSQNNNIKLKDISVSRNHCNIIKRKNNLFVVDKGSKFGSLLYINNPLNINSNNNVEAIISGRHWFSIQLEENRSFFSKLFSVKCCENNLIKKNTNIDIEHLDEKNFDNQNEIINDNDNANLKDNKDKDVHRILDNSYQDYILDLGNEIYLHDDQSDSEDLK